MIISLQEDIKSLKKSEMNGSSSNLEFEEIISEIEERNKRMCNIMVFGVKEQDNSGSPMEKIKKDKTFLTEMIEMLSTEISMDNIKPLRLGKYAQDKIRPIKIELTSEAQVNTIIRQGKKLKTNPKFKNIFVAPDRTPRQISYYKEVKNKLIERQQQGENCYIKYTNGIPKIVSSPLN